MELAGIIVAAFGVACLALSYLTSFYLIFYRDDELGMVVLGVGGMSSVAIWAVGLALMMAS